MAGSATKNLAIRQLLDAIVAYLPDPTRVPRTAVDLATNEEVALSADAAGPLVVQVFKTLADPFVGKLSYLRVYRGTLYSDSRVWNSRANEEERIGQLYMVRGKEQTPVPTLKAGDIGVVTRLSVTTTNDTLCDRGAPYQVPPITYPEPLYSVAVFPKTKADLDKLGVSLSRLVEEDPTLRVER
ncbi:MAG: elongation factor G, partial [Chloroflexi bacterium]|nr:elongation factor G [Chloroflexota bacterium]